MGRFRNAVSGESHQVGTKWIILIIAYLTVFVMFSDQIQNIVLWNFVMTLGGAMSYWDTVIGVFCLLLLFMAWDIGGDVYQK